MHLGRYELISRLARGGMGEVFLARRRGPGDIEKRVVIKRIRRELSGDPRFVDLFLSEARVSMTLSHKNIVPVFDFGRAGAELFLAMEYVRGRDLARALRAAGDERRLSPTAIAHVGIEVCRALEYAHGRGDAESIVHRDLSPKNLLLSFSGEVVVADFGLAIPATGDLATTGVRGTPAYLSPEQARGEAIDGRSDLFSLGLVLREMLTGQRGHGSGEPAELIARARTGELEPLAGDLPDKLAEVIDRATRADPDERFATARDMQLALDDFLIAGRAAGAEPPGHEIADWLAGLFSAAEAGGEPIDPSQSGDLDAVTFLEDGSDAVSADIRRSVVETVGDTAAPEPEAEPDPASATGRRRVAGLLIAAAVAAAAGGILWVTGAIGDDDGSNRALVVDAAPVADATPAIDAPAPIPDAAPPADAPPPPIDAPPPQPGVLEVSTNRGWARVVVLGTDRRCPETPCRFTLRPGRYTLEIHNPVGGARSTRVVRIKPGQTMRLVVPL